MNLADRQAYPLVASIDQQWEAGMTFRERLIVALAGNPLMIKELGDNGIDRFNRTSEIIIKQADAIIKQLEGEKK